MNSQINNCPITGDDTKFKYLDLGDFPLVNNLNNTREDSLNCERFPLSVSFYKQSRLTALDYVVDGKKLFQNYLFKSEVNYPYIEHCKKMFSYIKEITNLFNDSLIIDIGGNDGTLLNSFREVSDLKLNLLNIDPSINLTKISEEKGIPTLCDFFSEEVSNKIGNKADVVVSTNVFQHLKDINSFVKGVYNLLKDNGIWVLEFPYWIHDMETLQFDQIYHEHVYYYSIIPLNLMMKKHGLKIIRVQKQKIHGGTVRLVMAKESSILSSDGSVDEYLKYEEKFDEEYYKEWDKRVNDHLDKCKNLIFDLKSKGYKIAGFGAAAKGCIFLNSIGIDYNHIDYIIDDTDIKQGKFIPGTGIEVVSRKKLKENKVDYIIILTHNFYEFIVDSVKKEYDGKFIVFLPDIKII